MDINFLFLPFIAQCALTDAMTDQDSLPGLVITTNATTQEGTKSGDLRQGPPYKPIKLKMADRPQLTIELPGTKSMVVHKFNIKTNTVRGRYTAISES